jgi:hypothetical protein
VQARLALLADVDLRRELLRELRELHLRVLELGRLLLALEGLLLETRLDDLDLALLIEHALLGLLAPVLLLLEGLLEAA